MCQDQIEEDIDHLFFTCPFAKSYRQRIGIQWDEHLTLLPRLAEARSQYNLPFFMEATLIASWEIWKLTRFLREEIQP